jgi:hypothetical protein
MSQTRQITVTGERLHIVATFHNHPAQIRQILRRAGLGRALREDPARAERPALDAPLPAGVTSYHGLGFDTCTAPSTAAMSAWRAHSPCRAIGIYLGGSDEACAQPNLTRSWLATQAAQGRHFMPVHPPTTTSPCSCSGAHGQARGSRGRGGAFRVDHLAERAVMSGPHRLPAVRGDDPGAGVEPDTVLAQVRGECLAQASGRAGRGCGIQPLQ